MAIFNTLLLKTTCPRCGADAEMEAEFRFGLRDLSYYHIGDLLRWDGAGTRTPDTRPPGGNYEDEAYAVCLICKRDFWLKISVKNDIIIGAVVNTEKQPYISNEDAANDFPEGE